MSQDLIDNRIPFSEHLIEICEKVKNVVVVCNDSVGSSNLNDFKSKFPDRLFDVGIAEQNMVGVAAGLSQTGLIPVVCAASPFLTGRALEQIKADICYSNANVKLCGMSPGLAYGELGPTHHSIEDLSWLRALDNLTVIVPADSHQTKKSLEWAVNNTGPVFLRISRYKVPSVSLKTNFEFDPLKAERILDGNDATIFATGTMVSVALQACKNLSKENIYVRLVNISTISPIDTDEIISAAKETGRILSVEESIERGGLGGAISEILSQNHPVKLKILGVKGFAPTGTVDFLFDYFGLTTKNIENEIKKLIVEQI